MLHAGSLAPLVKTRGFGMTQLLRRISREGALIMPGPLWAQPRPECHSRDGSVSVTVSLVLVDFAAKWGLNESMSSTRR